MPETTPQSIAEVIRRRVMDPDARRDVASLGYLRSVGFEDGVAMANYELPAHVATDPLQQQIREQTKAAVSQLEGVRDVIVNFQVVAQRDTNTLPGVKNVVAVGAGKGGVGKSTVAAILACGLTRRGLKAGLLDADVYGPSLPKITGTENAQPYADDQGRIIPPEKDGLRIMSMGYLIPSDQAVVWRGPMAQKYVKEFLDRGMWGELDYLIVDLPPGTGDIPLTLAQSIPLTGAIVVCTPQDVALLDASKAVLMYRKLGVEVIGMVENMSFYVCPHCGSRDPLFGEGGAERMAAEMNVPFLGGIPLNLQIRESGDAGTPFANFDSTDEKIRMPLEEITTALVEQVETRNLQGKPLPQLKVR